MGTANADLREARCRGTSHFNLWKQGIRSQSGGPTSRSLRKLLQGSHSGTWAPPLAMLQPSVLQIHTTLPSAMAGGSTRPSFIVRVISHCAALPPYSPLSLHSSSLHYNQVSLSMHQTLAPDRCGCSLKPRAGAAVCCRCSLFPELTGPGPAFVHPWPSSVGQATVQCSEWSQQAGSWDAPRSGTRHGALSALCG